MNTINLKSDTVTLFPVSFERPNRPTARLLTEQNILSLVKGATGQDSFVITSAFDENSEFEFVIHSYHVKCEPGWFQELQISEDHNCVVAYITVDESSPQMHQIIGKDEKTSDSDEYRFNGITFVSFNNNNESGDIPSSTTSHVVYKLTLLEKTTDMQWAVPEGSGRTYPVDVVDGGVV